MRNLEDTMDVTYTDDDESREVRAQNIPILSSLEEPRAHRLVHWPLREWCKLGRGKEKPHHRTDRKRDSPQVFLDCCFVARDGYSSPATLLVMADTSSGGV